MAIQRLLYRSEMNLAGTAAAVQMQIDDIVRVSAARNAADDLTGALLHTRGLFIQVLEGPPPALEATFERICCDFRHRRVELIELVEAEERLFELWSMGQISADQTVEWLVAHLPESEDQELKATSAQTTIQFMRTLMITALAQSDSLKQSNGML